MYVTILPSFLLPIPPPYYNNRRAPNSIEWENNNHTEQDDLWLLDLIRRCKNNMAHRRELCIIIIIIADALAQDRTRSPEFSRNPNSNVATKKCADRRACVRGRWCPSLSYKTRGCLVSPLYPIYKSFRFSPFQKSFSFFFLVF